MTEAMSPYGVVGVILTIRGQKVILDADLARIYGVEVKRLNEQVKRNRNRFPTDFVFQLTPEEAEKNLKSQFATSSMQPINNQSDKDDRSRVATASAHGGRRKLPYAFTEHGAIMAAAVLNSIAAVEMSVFVVRAFVKMREQLMATVTLASRLAEVEKSLLTHDTALRDLYQKIRPLLLPPPEPERKRIGFGVREKRAQYRVTRQQR